jgi:hypothetical protein
MAVQDKARAKSDGQVIQINITRATIVAIILATSSFIGSFSMIAKQS